jgi:hypothetical protein
VIEDFLVNMAVNHNVQIEYSADGSHKYEAESPDEVGRAPALAPAFAAPAFAAPAFAAPAFAAPPPALPQPRAPRGSLHSSQS